MAPALSPASGSYRKTNIVCINRVWILYCFCWQYFLCQIKRWDWLVTRDWNFYCVWNFEIEQQQKQLWKICVNIFLIMFIEKKTHARHDNENSTKTCVIFSLHFYFFFFSKFGNYSEILFGAFIQMVDL